jgi:VanZ family protein
MKKKSIIMIVLVVAWMGLIFKFSSEPGNISTHKSDSVLKAIQGISKNTLSNEKKKTGFGYTVSIRKTAHVCSYLMLSILIFTASTYITKSQLKSYKNAFIISFIYAVSDEVHQFFIPGRTATVRDVFIDMFGVVLGMCIVAIVLSIYKHKSNKKIGQRGV